MWIDDVEVGEGTSAVALESGANITGLSAYVYTRYLRAYRPSKLVVLAYSREDADKMANETGHDVTHYQEVDVVAIAPGVLVDS